MARPSTHADLPNYETTPEEVGGVDLTHISSKPGALAAYGQFLDALTADGEYRLKNGRIMRDRTEEDLDRKLKDAQDSWDRGQKLYIEWQNTGAVPSYTGMWQAFLAAEGIANPTKADK